MNSAQAQEPDRAKVARTMALETASGPTIPELQAEVTQLKSYIDELHAFIDSHHLVSSTSLPVLKCYSIC